MAEEEAGLDGTTWSLEATFLLLGLMSDAKLDSKDRETPFPFLDDLLPPIRFLNELWLPGPVGLAGMEGRLPQSAFWPEEDLYGDVKGKSNGPLPLPLLAKTGWDTDLFRLEKPLPLSVLRILGDFP